MNKKASDSLRMICVVLFVLIMTVLAGTILYHAWNIEYKYTADIDCYDKYGSIIAGVECTHDIYCGPWQESTMVAGERISCDAYEVKDE